MIERVIHHNIQNGYTIAKAKSEQGDITLVGNFKCMKGEKINIKGKSIFNKIYGAQISVTNFEKVTELDESEIKNYLVNFNGIGPSRAKKIVDAFGKKSLDKIKASHLELVNIGIPEDIAKEIHDEFVKNDIVNKLVEDLKPFGLSLKKIYQIYERYKEESITVIKTNPYRLVEDISGIEFSDVDNIAQSIGVSHDSGNRTLSAIKHTLTLAGEQGHTYLPVEELISNVSSILSYKYQLPIDNNYILQIIMHMEEYRQLIIEPDKATYLPMYYNAERYAARKLTKIRESKSAMPICINPSGLIDEIEKEIGVGYAGKQREAIEASLVDKVLVVTGGPGTGKTTTVNGIIRAIMKNNPDTKIKLAAPTGRAAKRMEESTGKTSSTMHRILEYKPYGDELICGRNEDDPIDADVLIFDEFSMVDILLLDKLLKAVQNTTNIIIVGDIDQLPSVGAGNVLADVINSNVIKVVRLDTIFRQAGTSPIVTNARLINSGEMPELTHKDFTFDEIDDEEQVAIKIVEEYVRLLSEGYTMDEIQVLSPLKKKTACGSKNLNMLIQAAVNPPCSGKPEVNVGSGYFRLGDKVMQTRNNYEKDCFNGDFGYIVQIMASSKDPVIIVQFDGDKKVEFTGREEIMELELSYACTVHKSQGSEYLIVLMPTVLSHRRMLKKNLFYTGITRGKRTVKLIGSRKAIEFAVKNDNIEVRYSKFYKRILN